MSFDVAAESYDLFMGRYSTLLSAQLADLAGIAAGLRVLDVGCGPGALTAELVRRVGTGSVTAADPSESFVEATRARFPGVRVEQASAEALPFADGVFDAALAQLVVHFMADPVQGLREMARVARRGGAVGACVWDHGGGRGPLSVFFRAVRELDPGAPVEQQDAGAHEGHLRGLFEAAGLEVVEDTVLSVSVEHPTFEEWWMPYTLGVGPSAGYMARLEPDRLERLRELCRASLPPAPFVLDARAWTVIGRTA